MNYAATIDGRTFTLGRHISDPDEHDHAQDRYLALAAPLPAKGQVPSLPAVLNQGDYPYCVDFSGATGRCLGERPEGKITVDPMDMAAHCNAYMQGTQIRTAAAFLRSSGGLIKTANAPLRPGQRSKIGSYARLTAIDQVKTAILTPGSYGAWLGVLWDDAWFKPLASGMLPKPTSSMSRRLQLGHALWAVAFDDTLLCPDGSYGAVEPQNSWSATWGNGGRCWLPYSQLPLAGTSYDFEAWQTFDAPDQPYKLTLAPFAAPRIWRVRKGQTLSGWRLASPDAPVKTVTWTKDSWAHATAEVTIAWVDGTTHKLAGGPWLQVSDGAYAGLLIHESEVTLA